MTQQMRNESSQNQSWRQWFPCANWPHHLTAVHSNMPTDSIMKSSHSIHCRSGTCCCCGHNFSFSELSTSFTSKPPCRPTPLCLPAACYTTAAFQQRSPASIAAALKQAPPLTTAADDRLLQVSYMIHDRAERAVDEIEQQLQHRGSRCYRNWHSTVEAGAIEIGPSLRKAGN